MSDHQHEPEDDISQMMYMISGALLAVMVIGYFIAF